MKFPSKAFSFLSFTAASSAIVASAQVAPTTSRPNGGPVGQTAPDPQQSQQTSDNAFLQPHQSTSLLRVAMSTQVPQPQTTPGQQNSLANISFLAVPEAKPKVVKKHDIVTLIIREESEYSSEGTTDLKKQADLNAAITDFVRFNLANKALQSNIGSAAPTIAMNGSHNFKGEATVDRTDSYTQRIGAEVIDVKPNGTLVLQAMKTIQTDEEEQSVILSGVCRAEDITADDTVLSTQLHDLTVRKMHKGAVRDTTKRGWVPRLLDVLNPF
jgi:flagellar L-ring protein precursor FlgH